MDTGFIGKFSFDFLGHISLDNCYGALCAMVY